AIAVVAASFLAHRKGATQAKDQVPSTVAAVNVARRAFAVACTAADSQHATERKRLQDEYDKTFASLEDRWKRADVIEAVLQSTGERKLTDQLPRLTGKLEARLRTSIGALDAHVQSQIAGFQSRADAERRRFYERHESEVAALRVEEQSRWEQLEAEWK